jgi:hypothetical protein
MQALNREIKANLTSFTYKMLFDFFFMMLAFNITASASSINPVVTDSLYFNIMVNTNINCFTCDYSSQISDPISVIPNAIKNQYTLESGWQLIPVSRINCHNNIMNNDMMEMLKADIYPNIKIKIDPFQVDRELGNERKGYLTVSINGINKIYEVPLINCVKSPFLCIVGNVIVNLNDFGISPPSKFFGLITADNIIRINFKMMINNIDLNRLLTEKDGIFYNKTKINK